MQLLVWNQLCDPCVGGSRDVRLRVQGLGDAGRARVTEFRIDENHSNAHTVWEQLGCPDWPDDGQIAAMRAREGLERLQDDRTIEVADGALELGLTLPTHAVSLLLIEECAG